MYLQEREGFTAKANGSWWEANELVSMLDVQGF